MEVVEIVGGILLLITCVLTILLCLMQDQKADQNMTSAITGASNDSFYGKNAGRTKEAILCKITRVLATIFFLATIAVTIIPVYVTT